MGEIIRTVLGDIESDQLGVCQCHEHIFLEMDKSFEISKVLYMDDLQKSIAELMEYRTAGGCSVVDAQPVMAGRMAEYLMAASKKSGVHIIASTGFHKTVFYYEDSYVFKKNEQYISDLYISEITEGMISSKSDGLRLLDTRAGMIKVAIDSGGIFKDKIYEKLFCSAANAASLTGASIMCHIEQGTEAMQVVDFFGKKDIEAERIILCHLDRARYDFAYHKDVLQTGAYLEYDTINRLKYLSNNQEIELIIQMIDAGFENRLLLSLDTTSARMRAYGAEMGLDYLLKEFIPMLCLAGVSTDTVYKMQSENPKAVLKIKI